MNDVPLSYEAGTKYFVNYFSNNFVHLHVLAITDTILFKSLFNR